MHRALKFSEEKERGRLKAGHPSLPIPQVSYVWKGPSPLLESILDHILSCLESVASTVTRIQTLICVSQDNRRGAQRLYLTLPWTVMQKWEEAISESLHGPSPGSEMSSDWLAELTRRSREGQKAASGYPSAVLKLRLLHCHSLSLNSTPSPPALPGSLST